MSELPMPTKKSSLLVPEEHAKAEHGKVSTSYTIFLIVVLIVMAFVTAVFITNAVFYEAIRKQAGACGTAVSKNEADVLFWLNVVLAVIAAILLLASIVLLFFAYKKPEFTEKYIGKYHYGSKVKPLAEHVGLRAEQFGRGVKIGGAAARRAGERFGRAAQPYIGAARGGAAGAGIGFRDPVGVGARGLRLRSAPMVSRLRSDPMVSARSQ
uniref:Transmembrane protein n=1 Tax=Pithovirus LCPAC304 TaxID=2506594 RepID=A0A481ZBA6_9VIRU|nr:MAG: hypothetical protein LCPAC304_02930 [Pithovirus LCPAC304]